MGRQLVTVVRVDHEAYYSGMHGAAAPALVVPWLWAVGRWGLGQGRHSEGLPE
jgi:hypothetical protein